MEGGREALFSPRYSWSLHRKPVEAWLLLNSTKRCWMLALPLTTVAKRLLLAYRRMEIATDYGPIYHSCMNSLVKGMHDI